MSPDQFRELAGKHAQVNFAREHALLAHENLEAAVECLLFAGNKDVARKLARLGAELLRLDFTIPPPPR